MLASIWWWILGFLALPWVLIGLVGVGFYLFQVWPQQRAIKRIRTLLEEGGWAEARRQWELMPDIEESDVRVAARSIWSVALYQGLPEVEPSARNLRAFAAWLGSLDGPREKRDRPYEVTWLGDALRASVPLESTEEKEAEDLLRSVSEIAKYRESSAQMDLAAARRESCGLRGEAHFEAGRWELAAKWFELAKDVERGADARMQQAMAAQSSERWQEACDLYVALANTHKATDPARLKGLERTRLELGALAQAEGEFERAIDLYRAADADEKASACLDARVRELSTLGQHERAAELCAKLGDATQAMQLFVQAATAKEAAGYPREAAALWRRAGQPDKARAVQVRAAEWFEEKERWSDAGARWLEIGDKARSGVAYGKAAQRAEDRGQDAEAATFWAKAGERARETAARERVWQASFPRASLVDQLKLLAEMAAARAYTIAEPFAAQIDSVRIASLDPSSPRVFERAAKTLGSGHAGAGPELQRVGLLAGLRLGVLAARKEFAEIQVGHQARLEARSKKQSLGAKIKGDWNELSRDDNPIRQILGGSLSVLFRAGEAAVTGAVRATRWRVALSDANRAAASSDVKRAAELYAQVLKEQPQCVDAIVGLASCAARSGDAAFALGCAELAPSDARAAMVVSTVYANLGCFDLSAAAAESACQLTPPLAEAHLLAGAYGQMAGDAVRARNGYRRAIELDARMTAEVTVLGGEITEARVRAICEAWMAEVFAMLSRESPS